ncbi:GNAT family N-acetyltransferase [Nocardioides carbamazepini]|uniref:GNAT family N-acetyltransferase n=1 Tax=Nocardioides carbamazepini TaxID=2854259 RepID=UPI00214A0AB5|nr:GNAT family N-acetyltransferase [Nocardioides carbamazepini]MCR1784653.1 GNAT family N-acetyltransferase [Nocardioides carbamazepini]
MRTGYEFRTATPDDVPALVALVESAYRGDVSRQGWTTEADLLQGQRTDAEEVRRVVGAPDSVVLVALDAEEDGRVAACCHVERRGDRAYFGLFAVDPTRQGDGLGKKMLARAEEVARATWGSTHLEMTVIRQRTDLIAYYLRRGYVDTERRTPFPYGDERFGLPQRDDLEFTLLEKPLG